MEETEKGREWRKEMGVRGKKRIWAARYSPSMFESYTRAAAEVGKYSICPAAGA